MGSMTRLAVWTAVLLSAVVATVSAQQASRNAIADASLSSTQLDFEPRVSSRAWAWSLRVTGPAGFVFEKRNEGTPPSFSVFDKAGHVLVDGPYVYELRAERRPASSAIRRGETADGRTTTRRVPLPELPALSGAFTVAGGSIVLPQKEEPAAPRVSAGVTSQRGASAPRLVPRPNDQVTPDDMIVQGSLCVGDDCVNNEDFGFDTLRLKENNTRMKFEDTSVGAFPTTDWQLTANDSDSGGANRFSIEDISAGRIPFTVTANAPTNSLYVDSSGRLGLKTAAPAVEIHSSDGDTPTLRLEQNGGSGFSPQTWDVAGNETNFFVRDVTGGSRLPLRIRPGAPTDSISVASSGDVGFAGRIGVGTLSPAAKLHVVETDVVAVRLERLASTTDRPSAWDVRVDPGRLGFQGPAGGSALQIGDGAADGLLRVGLSSASQVEVNGDLVVYGTITPDYVFHPGYPLPSISDQGASMWRERHLPALPPAETTPDGRGVIDLGRRSQGMLEELEKAHIYIQQLDERLRALGDAVAAKEAELAQLRREVQALREARP